jgi:hypothetical protein
MTTLKNFKVCSANYPHYLGENDAGEIIWTRSIYRAKVFDKTEFDRMMETNPWLLDAELLFLGA